MSPEFQRTIDDAEPKAERSPAPIAIIILFTLTFYFGLVYLNDHSGGFNSMVYEPYANVRIVDSMQVVDPIEEFRRKGKLVFNNNCAVCHQQSGLGLPGQFPPLAGSEWVAYPSPHRIIRAVLNGLTGPITVTGKPFNNTMVPWKSLSDDDLAAVLTFVRQNKEWGNSAPAVTPQQVKKIRDKIADRASPFTPDELQKIPDDL